MFKSWTLVLLFAVGCASFSSAQWVAQQSNLPEGVRAWRLTVVNENVVWACGQRDYLASSNDFTRTIDGGEHWTAGKIPDVMVIINISAFDSDTAWVAVAYKSTYAVVKTRDGGKTWQEQWTAPTFVNFVHFFNAREGLALCDPIDIASGYYDYLVFTTSDGGATWQAVPADQKAVLLFYKEGISHGDYNILHNTLYSGTSNGKFLVATDKGKGWKAYPCWNQGFIWPSFKDSLNGMAAATTMANHYATLITSDGGVSWQKVSSPDFLAYFPAAIPETPGGYLLSGAGWGLGKNGSAFTLDNGTTWTMIDDEAHLWTEFYNRETGWSGDGESSNIYKWSLTQAPAIGCYPVSTMKFNQTVTTWSSTPAELSITNYGQEPLILSEITVPPDFSISREFELPKTLQSLETARIKVTFIPRTAEIIVDSLILVSNATASPRHAIRLEGEGFTIALAQAGQCYAAASKNLYSIDPATGKASLITPVTIGKSLQNLAINPVTGILIGVNSSAAATEFYAVSATDGKTNLQKTVAVGGMRPIAFRSDTLFGGTSTGELYRIDLTAGTAALMGTAPGVKYNALAFHPANGELYASITSASGTQKDRIVKVNTSNGDTTLVGATGDNVMMPALAFSPAGVLYALKAATGSPVITIDLLTGKGTAVGNSGIASLSGLAWAPNTTAVDQYADAAPGAFTLLQNYPNPFNPITTIRFTLVSREEISLRVYNILGAQVATLMEGQAAAGDHALIWDANQHAGGVYYIVLRAGQDSQIRKAVLLK